MEYIIQYIVSYFAFFIAYFAITLAFSIFSGKVSIGKSKKVEQNKVNKGKQKSKGKTSRTKKKETSELYRIFRNALFVSFIFVIGIIIYKMMF